MYKYYIIYNNICICLQCVLADSGATMPMGQTLLVLVAHFWFSCLYSTRRGSLLGPLLPTSCLVGKDFGVATLALKMVRCLRGLPSPLSFRAPPSPRADDTPFVPQCFVAPTLLKRLELVPAWHVHLPRVPYLFLGHSPLVYLFASNQWVRSDPERNIRSRHDVRWP
jgi:hypothetical protein